MADHGNSCNHQQMACALIKDSCLPRVDVCAARVWQVAYIFYLRHLARCSVTDCVNISSYDTQIIIVGQVNWKNNEYLHRKIHQSVQKNLKKLIIIIIDVRTNLLRNLFPFGNLCFHTFNSKTDVRY